MIWALVSCVLGLLAGFVLIRRFPTVPLDARSAPQQPKISIVIPARNEAHNLPALLNSLPSSARAIIVDDNSTDATAQIGRSHGAEIVSCDAPPPGWLGKTWACHQGALTAQGGWLLFLDADTYFTRNGYQKFVNYALSQPATTAFSVLPFHQPENVYEDLSLFFHLLMAFGAAGFTRIGSPQLVGPSLLLSRNLYAEAGGYAAVHDQILENLSLTEHIRHTGAHALTLCGRGVLNTRMFPQGFSQLCASWRKAFADGAGKTPKPVLALSILWLGGASSACALLVITKNIWLFIAIALYLAFAAQIAWAARQVGRYRWISLALFPIPLIFYFVVFSQSLWNKLTGNKVTWKERQV